jgi:signal transduction histidine kinase
MTVLPNILLVDDRPENLLYLKAVLKNVEANLIVAETGTGALQATDGIELSLAILDIMMPGMDGYELAQELNAQRQEQKVPIIFVTAISMSEQNTLEGYHLGAVDYIFKPINNFILLSKVNVFLELFRQKQLLKEKIHSDRLINLGRMASGIAHEINQPLHSISMTMDNILLSSKNMENFSVEYLEKKSVRIFENIFRIRNIIDHIRMFSRNHDDLICTEFDINESIKGALSMVSEQFRHSGIFLDLHLSEQPLNIVGDVYKMEQVFLNLLNNASDAIKEQSLQAATSGEKRIKIKSFQQDESLIVEVTDNGIGIPEDQIDQVVLPFYTNKEYRKGTGLGLSISYHIVSEMKGKLLISSEPNIGTSIKLVFNAQHNWHEKTRRN